MTHEEFAMNMQVALNEALAYVVDQRNNGTPSCADLATFYGQKLWQMRGWMAELEGGEYPIDAYPDMMTEQDYVECTCDPPDNK